MKSFSRKFLYELYKTNDHRTGKGQLSFQSQRKAMPRNVQTTAQLHSSQVSKVMLKLLQARLQPV